MFRYIPILICLLVFSSCNDSLVYSTFKPTNGGSWAKDEHIAFEFTAPDSLNTYNLFILLRNDDDFPYSNLFLIASLDFPDGTTLKDTLEYEMARPDGSWLGKGAGSIKENKLWYKENIVFPFNGVYTLELMHAMRKNGNVEGIQNLPGIIDIGLEIEKSK